MKGKRPTGGTRREAEAVPLNSHFQRYCNEDCRFFLEKSLKIAGMGLCSNPNYIKSREMCLSTIGAECDYYSADDNDLTDSRYISFGYTGRENRQFSRGLVYNYMVLEIVRWSKVIEYPSIVLDISLEGVGCIVPVIMKSLPKEFSLIKDFGSGKVIRLKCQTRRVTKHSNVTEIGASFSERISEDVMDLLLKAK